MQIDSTLDDTVTLAQHFPVLVTDCQAVGMIGVIRSLGEAGYPVHACSHKPDALGLKSNFTHKTHVSPGYDSNTFLQWLDEVIAKEGIRAIIPSEGFLLAIREHFDKYHPLLPLAEKSPRIFDFFSKCAITEELLASESGRDYIPPSIILNPQDPSPSEDDITRLGLPVFVKVDAIDGIDNSNSAVIRATNPSEALKQIKALRESHRKVLVQGFVPGVGLGAYFLISEGVVLQQFMNKCLHEVPHTGGYCSLRSSCENDAIMQDAKHKLEALGWNGIAMVEYRWDEATGEFWFVEINARFWAALHVALYAGVDFPKTLVDVFRGDKLDTSNLPSPKHVLSRHTVPFEIGYATSVLRDGSLSTLAKCRKIGAWILYFMNPSVRDDLFYPKDRKLYFYQWANFLKGLFK